MNLREWALSLVLLGPVAALAADSTPQDKFKKGLEAYRAGDYAAALANFLEVQPSGWNTANLQFDLGLTYYRLHRYTEAQAAFEELRKYPDYKRVANYHLGLIAARLGDRERALALWQPLAASAPEQALRDRATTAIGQLEPGSEPGPGIFFAAAAGYDSNPALLEESVQTRNSASANLDLLGTAGSTLSRTEQRDFRLRVGGYLRQYTRNNRLDQDGAFVGLVRVHTGQERVGAATFDIGSNLLHGGHFLDTLSAGYASTPRRGTGGGVLSAQVTRLQAPARYAYLEGWRLRGTAEWIARTAPLPWRLSYTLDFNDRADLAVGDQFFSHSPIRNSLGLVLRQSGPDRWSFQWNMRARYSRYRDSDRALVGGTLIEERRIERLLQAGVRVRHALARGTFCFLDYEYSHNASTIGVFTYNRHLLQLGLEWTAPGR